MNTLRIKFVALLVLAIMTVVVSLTIVLFYLLGPPPRSGRALEAAAQQVEMMLRLSNEGLSAFSFTPEPSSHHIYERRTKALRAKLAKRGPDIPIVVSRERRHGPLIVSVPVKNRR